MPPRALSRNISDDIGNGLESRRISRQPQISRFAAEKPLFPHASKGFKSKDKIVKVDNSIRPPHSDLPFEFVKNAHNNVFVVETKFSGSQGVSREEELVKYMSKVPAYLHRENKPQDNAFNFGVLDWQRLQKWTNKRDKTATDRIARHNTASCSLYADCSSVTANVEALDRSREQPSVSNSNSVHIPAFSPAVEPLSGEALKRTGLQTSLNDLMDVHKEICMKDTALPIDAVNLKPAKWKHRNLIHQSCVLTGIPSSELSSYDHEIIKSLSRNFSDSEGEALTCSANSEGRRLDAPHQNCNDKQESVVLLFPKDFSSSGSSKVDPRTSLDGKSAEHNWGSFSDIFSIDEIQPDELFSDISRSWPLDAAETETELDSKLDTLINAQGSETLANQPDIPVLSANKMKAPIGTSMIPKAFTRPDRIVEHISAEISGGSLRSRRFSSGIARMRKSLSFREGSVQPSLSSPCVTAKSGPAKPEYSTYNDSRSCNKANMNSRVSASPVKRLLDPLFRSKVGNQLSEQANGLSMKPPIPNVAEDKKNTASPIKALLHFAVKSGLPLFKFVVEVKHEIFASTVKSLSSLGKDDVNWLYTFYSVHKLKKRSGGWKNHWVKPCGSGYKIVGQMKVSEPHFPSWCKQKSEEKRIVKESVLYDVGVSQVDAVTSELKTSRELAAIVVNVPDTAQKSISFYNEHSPGGWFSNLKQNNLGHIVVILPDGDHSLPHRGVPSSLINRWRSGGSCDCGGWDIGCKLRILSDKSQHPEFLKAQCDLYDQEEAKQCRLFYSLIPLQDGLFSVEFDPEISSLQAFSISVALMDSQKHFRYEHATDQAKTKQEFGILQASMGIKREGTEKHAPHPPPSPVGRV